MFCTNLLHSRVGYSACQMVWCGGCYLRVISDKFQVNEPMDEDEKFFMVVRVMLIDTRLEWMELA